MKKILKKIILLIILFPLCVFAEGGISVSPSSISLEVGSTKTFTISAYNTIGDVTISSSNSGVASLSSSEWSTGMVGEKETKTGIITVKGNAVGTASITLTIDAATFDGDDLAGQIKTITVNVTEKVVKPNNSDNNSNNGNNDKPTNNVVSNLSKNNNLKNLTVVGHKLVKVDNNNYTLTVSNNISSIEVKAEAEDSKAKITGAGSHKLNIGENNIKVVVTSESGSNNTINIKITRKDGYYLEDLDMLLKDGKVTDINIIIDDKCKLSSEVLKKIKDSKKIVNFNYFNKDKKLVYSWIIDGGKLDNTNEILTSILYESEFKKKIFELSNYADGLYVSFKHINELSNGIKVKLYLLDKFENDSIVNVYSYDNNGNILDIVEDGLVVKDGYIELGIDYGFDYFVSMSNINNNISNVNDTETDTYSANGFIIIFILELIMLVVFVVIYFVKIKPMLSVKKDVIDKDVKYVENADNGSVYDNFFED